MFPPRRANPHGREHDSDAAIRATDTDASQARISAVRKQYLRDPFITALVQRPHLIPARPPLINIGTYVRSEAIDELVLDWLHLASADGKKVQIVSLGAGSDTRFWRIATGQLGEHKNVLARYLELDFSEITAHKVETIKQKNELHAVVGDFTATDHSLTSSVYAVHNVDLRSFQARFSEFLRSPGKESSSFKDPLLDPSLPTLVIAECVFVYMGQAQSDALIKWFSNTFSTVGVIVYEMFGLNDSFGRVMRENLKARNVLLPGVDAYPTLEAQSRRFIDQGLTCAYSLSLRTIRNQYIALTELQRIAKLELVDEIEELELVLDHYVISWACGIKPSPGTASARSAVANLTAWGLKPKANVGAIRDA